MEVRYFVGGAQAIARAGIKSCLATVKDLRFVGDTGLPGELANAVRVNTPDVVILEEAFAWQVGEEQLHRLVTSDPSPALLILGDHEKTESVERALQVGALGFLPKDATAEALANAVRRVAQRELAVNPQAFATLLRGRKERPTPTGDAVSRLSEREMEVFRLTGQGLEAKEIAGMLNLSPRTVDVHRANIRHKLGIRGAHELMRYAMHWEESQNRSELERRFSADRRPLLLVEDDEVDILSVRRALHELRAENPLMTARSGEEALEYLRSSENVRPTLILLDVHMPGLAGYEFLAELRKDPKLAALPVVTLTSSQNDEDKARMFALGAAGYLLKPNSSTQYLEMFRTLAKYWSINERPLQKS
ncbi:MAG: response regulator [Limisphaerales bacterium]